MTPTPVPPSHLEEWLGPPEDLIGYVVVGLLAYGGVKVIQRLTGMGTMRQGRGLTVIQESGPGDVQEQSP